MRRPPRPSSPDRRTLLAAAAALALPSLVSSCGLSEPPVDDSGRIRLRFALDGPAGPGHGGFYQALATGLYEQHGLDVRFLPGVSAADLPHLLASGAIELGLAPDTSVSVRLLADNAPVRASAAFFQKSPHILVTHDTPAPMGIGDLRDPVFLIDDSTDGTLWPWLKTRFGFTDAQRIATQPAPTDVAHRVQLASLTTFIPTGTAPHVLIPADEGYPDYGGLLLAPNAFARDNPEALRAFIAASAQGWNAYLEGDPGPAHGRIRRDNPAQTGDHLAMIRQALRDHDLTGPSAAIGTMSEDRWKAVFDLQPPSPSTALDWRQAFTTDFLRTG